MFAFVFTGEELKHSFQIHRRRQFGVHRLQRVQKVHHGQGGGRSQASCQELPRSGEPNESKRKQNERNESKTSETKAKPIKALKAD